MTHPSRGPGPAASEPKAYRSLWRLILYAPGLYALNLAMWMSTTLLELVPGLVAKSFFDMLGGQIQLPWGVWSIIAAVVAWALARLAVMLGAGLADVRHRFVISMLLRRNMLAYVLGQPGAVALPGSPGACKDGWDGILKDQLDYRFKPCNFVELMPRLQEHIDGRG